MSDKNLNGPWGGSSNGAKPSASQPDRDKWSASGGDRNDIDEMLRKGKEQWRGFLGGGGGGRGGSNNSIGGGGAFGIIAIAFVAGLILWLTASFYRVDTSEQSVELLFGEYYKTGEEGLNFAPWPIVTKEILSVTRENIENIGVGGNSLSDEGLMLTGDENIVDIDFQVVWNISDVQKYVFNIAEPRETIRAVSESVMREIVARTNLTPILTTGKGKIANELQTLIQFTLDNYNSGVQIIRVNFDKADPPNDVADSFREVQAAEQQRDTLEKQADAYSNRVVAESRGKAAQLIELAEGYRAQVVNQAEGESSRFTAVYSEYLKAPEVTRKRLYLETMEKVFSATNKIILDGVVDGKGGVVPYLPLNELIKKGEIR